MLNNSDFIIRLKKILQRNGLSAAAFAERIGVQRSSVSHILSERNKPSLDFVLKINEHFNDVNIEWLLFGKENSLSSFRKEIVKPPKEPVIENSPDLFQSPPPPIQTPKTPPVENHLKDQNWRQIDHVIEFYKDGSFHVYFPKS